MKRVFFLTIILLTVIPFRISGEDTIPVSGSLQRLFPEKHTIVPPQEAEPVDFLRLHKKHFWRATAEVAGLNIGLWAFDRFVQHGQYAYISWNSIKENIRHGFEWDNDHLSTNIFAHPYNGSLYFNAGRSNGYNFWQSELFAIGGSAMWELFMEREYPSTNDIIATPVGGAAIGEVLYRMSDIVLDDRTTGPERFGREFASFILSPMRGFTRLITGRSWEIRKTPGKKFGTPPVNLSLSLGTLILTLHNEKQETKVGLLGVLELEYGDKYESVSMRPYDFFKVMLELNVMPTQPLLNRLEICGSLASKKVLDSHHYDLTTGIYQHFDFFDSDTITLRKPNSPLDPCTVPYKLGIPACVGGGAFFRYAHNPVCSLEGYAHMNGILLGGVLSDFYRYYHRNYNWASGFSIKFGLSGNFLHDKLKAEARTGIYRLYTWGNATTSDNWSLMPNGRPVNIPGDDSSVWFHLSEFRLRYKIMHRLFATLGVDWYSRTTSYNRWMEVREDGTYWATNRPIIDSNQIGIKALLTYYL